MAPHLFEFLGLLVRLAFVGISCWFLLLSLSNIAWLRLSSRKPTRTRGREVSVLVPARDEERTIERCLRSLLDQSYENYEILVLDDQSSDRTGEIVARMARENPGRLRLLKGRPLSGGWNGKPHAMQQLAEAARGEYLLFTDADTEHGRDSVAWAVTNLEWHGADCVSGYVSQSMQTLGEQFIVPATYIMSAMVLPLWLVAALPSPAFSFAIGQLIVFRREAFDAVGGWACVRGEISDDLAIARELKRAGYREVFLDLRRHVRCRMYEGYRASFAGLAKNIYDIARHRSLLFAAAITLLACFVVLPLALLPIQVLTGSPAAQLTAAGVLAFLLAWSLVLYDRGLQWWVPLLYPVLTVHLLYMAWWCTLRAGAGRGVVWKGRTLR